MNLGWRGKRVKHDDGRTGEIRGEYAGFCHVALEIAVDGSAATARVQLNTNGPDTGEAGWMWCWHEAEGGGKAEWAYLGDHNRKKPAAA
jgi:hypothetical protein